MRILNLFEDGLGNSFAVDDFEWAPMEIGNIRREGSCDAELIVHLGQVFICLSQSSLPRSPVFSQDRPPQYRGQIIRTVQLLESGS